tara:strand:- start:1150 stop:1896 length:747 start_codon:yes stop_codon:yes gene_type:complete
VDNAMSQRQYVCLQLVLLIALGVVAFLMTGRPLIGILLPSIHASWRSLQTAIWLMRFDRPRSRGVICGLFCVATGCWKIAASALLSLACMVVLFYLTAVAPNMDRFAAVMTTLTVGVVMTSALGLMASVAAWVVGLRVWVHPELPDMLDEVRQCSPAESGLAKWNHAILVLVTSLAVPAVGGLGLALLQPGSVVRAVSMYGITLLAVLVTYWWLAPRILAEDPMACWSDHLAGRADGGDTAEMSSVRS